MRNARKMDARVTIGRVPSVEEIVQLNELGYRTLVDVREDAEKFDGRVRREALSLGMAFEEVPIARSGIDLADVVRFYRVLYGGGGAPFYVFSRFGKKPLAFWLLFEAVANEDPLFRVFQRASRFGVDLRGDQCLLEFLVDFFNSGRRGEVEDVVRELRPDLVKSSGESRRRGASRESPRLEPPVRRRDREHLLQQKGCTVWLTGLPSSGKSTLAFQLEHELLKRRFIPYVLDSDSIRHGVNNDLGFARSDREENIRRVGQIAKLFSDAGLITITSFISPYRADRQRVREIHEEAQLGFVEVFVDAPVEVCERRDPRGLYKSAREGVRVGVTGVDDPYESPLMPEVHVDTASQTPDVAALRILEHLATKGFLPSRVLPNAGS